MEPDNKRPRPNVPTTLDELWKQWEEERAEELQKLEASRTPFPALGTPQAAMQATPQAAMQAPFPAQAAMQAPFPAQAPPQATFPATFPTPPRDYWVSAMQATPQRGWSDIQAKLAAERDEQLTKWKEEIESTLRAARTEEQAETWSSKIEAEIEAQAAMQAAAAKEQAELEAMRTKIDAAQLAELDELRARTRAMEAKLEAKRAKFPKPLDFGPGKEYEPPSFNEEEQQKLDEFDEFIQEKMENATSKQIPFYQMLQRIAPLIFNQERVTLGIMMSHGAIPVTWQDGPATFTIPEGIEIKYVPFSNPGASCFVSGIRKDNYVMHINNFNRNSYGVTEDDLNEMLTETSKLIAKTYCEEFDQEFGSMKECKVFHEFGKKKGYSRITTVKPGERMVDYEYQNDTENDDNMVLFLPNKTEPIDISMLLYNLSLFEYKTDTGLQYRDIALSRIVHFFRNFRVKQLVIFDFSCSNFRDIHSGRPLLDPSDPEYQRLLKFMEKNAEIIKHGGKTRKTRSVKPRKTKKNHKRQKVSRKKKHPTTKRRTRH